MRAPITGLSVGTGAVVRKPSGKEPAGCGPQRCRRRYGDFNTTAEDAAAELRIGQLAARLWRGVAALGGALRNGEGPCVPHILNVSFEGVEGESQLAAVSERIAVSTGSACTSASREPSYVLRALGRSERLSESSLRFGLGRFTSEADIDAALDILGAALPRLRRIAGAL